MRIIQFFVNTNIFSAIPDTGQQANELFVIMNENTVVDNMATMFFGNYSMTFHDEVIRYLNVQGYGMWDENNNPVRFVDFLNALTDERSQVQSVRVAPDPFRHCTVPPFELPGNKRDMLHIPYGNRTYDYSGADFTPFCSSYR